MARLTMLRLLLLCLLHITQLVATPNTGNIISYISDIRIHANAVRGIAASRRHQDVIYTLINVYPTGRSVIHVLGANTGKILGTLNVMVPGMGNCTWGEITVGPSREHDHDTFIYIADIGVDPTNRCNTIYRVQEPEAVSGDVAVPLHGSVTFSYTAGNAETMMADEAGVVWLVSKVSGDAARPRLYMVPKDAWAQTGVVVDLGAGLELPVSFKDNYPTEGDISADGRWIILKSQEKVFGYRRDLTDTVEETLINTTWVRLTDVIAPAGVCWDLDGQGYYFLTRRYIVYFTNPLRYNDTCYAGGTLGEQTNGVVLSTVSDPRINEASGVAASRRHPDILYTHNDSGDPPYVYAFRASTGELVSILNLTGPGVQHCDWEDIAVGPASDTSNTSYIYIGDIGGNFHKCDVIYRVQEPETLLAGVVEVPVDGVVRYSYTGGNSETLMVDETGTVWLVSKVNATLHPHLYRVPVDAWSTNGMVNLGTGFKMPVAFEHEFPTAGDISPDGRWVVLRGYTKVFIYRHDPSRPLEETLVNGTPVEAAYCRERQGEGVCWDGAGTGYYTLSEGRYQSVWYYNNTLRYNITVPPTTTTTAMDTTTTAGAGSVQPACLTMVMFITLYFV